MIDRLSLTAPAVTGSQSLASSHAQGRKVLHMISSERTAGSIPSWQYAETPQNEIERNLSLAQNGDTNISGDSTNALAYRPTFDKKPDEEFKFADLVDMVNPLQHIPVVNHFYRKLTGDEIKPVGKIIGGTVFGGPAGLAGGLVNMIVEKETGRDITGNAMMMFTEGKLPSRKTTAPSTDFPAELLAFADVTRGADTQMKIEKQITKRPIWERD